VIFLATAVGIALSVGFGLLLRRTHDPTWTDTWQALDPDRRSRIAEAVKHARVASSPEDAALAVRFVDSVARWRRFSRWTGLGTVVFFVAWYAALGWTWLLYVVGGLVALEMVIGALGSRQLRRMRAARAANLTFLNQGSSS